MEFNIQGFEPKFKRIARTLGLEKETGQAVVNYLFDLNSAIHIPHRLREIGVKQEHLETLADLAIADCLRALGKTDEANVHAKTCRERYASRLK
jgi:alcohol dehydrogenase class IV